MSMEIRNPEIEAVLRECADEIASRLPEGWGLALFLFQFSDRPGAPLFYISTAQRPDMVKVIREWLNRQIS